MFLPVDDIAQAFSPVDLWARGRRLNLRIHTSCLIDIVYTIIFHYADNLLEQSLKDPLLSAGQASTDYFTFPKTIYILTICGVPVSDSFV